MRIEKEYQEPGWGAPSCLLRAGVGSGAGNVGYAACRELSSYILNDSFLFLSRVYCSKRE